jgi:hypothetical protein
LLKLEFWFAGVDKLDARSFVRNLTRRGVATSFMKDMGRQRVTCFVARRFTNNSKTNNEIEREMKKQEGLVTHFFNFCFFFGFLPFFGGGAATRLRVPLLLLSPLFPTTPFLFATLLTRMSCVSLHGAMASNFWSPLFPTQESHKKPEYAAVG